MTAFEWLIVALAIVVIVVLVLVGIVLFTILKIVRQLRALTSKADHVVANLENASRMVKNTAKPASWSKLIGNVVEMAKSSTDKKPAKKGKK